MPAKSEKQREAIAIAEHNPQKLYARNRGMLKMTKQQMHDYASTSGLSKPVPLSKLRRAKNNA